MHTRTMNLFLNGHNASPFDLFIEAEGLAEAADGGAALDAEAEGGSGDSAPDVGEATEQKAEAEAGSGKPAADDKKPDAQAAEAPKAEDYDFTLPEIEGLVDEKGEPFQFDADDPFLGRAREVMAKHGIAPEAAPELAQLVAEMQRDTASSIATANQEQIVERRTAEIGKLELTLDGGQTLSGEDRIKRLMTAADKVLGSGASQDLMESVTSAQSFLKVEALVEKAMGSSLATGEVKQEGGDALSRMNYKMD